MSGISYIAARPALRISLFYIAFAAAWIFLSDDLLSWLIPEIETISELQTYKGLVFVLITGGLLYRLVYRLESSPWRLKAGTEKHVAISRKFFPIFLFIWLSLAIGFSGWFIFSAMRDSVRHDTQHALVTNGTLKARQIESWLRERQDDLVLHTADDESVSVLSSWMYGHPVSLSMTGIRARFNALRSVHGFTGIEVYDKSGRPRFGDNTLAVTTEGDAALDAVLNNHPVLVDFHRDGQEDLINFGFMAPLRAIGGEVIGALYADCLGVVSHGAGLAREHTYRGDAAV